MRLALVSDIHGNLPALEAVEADLAGRAVDAVLNLGDSLSGPLLPLETARHLMATGWLHLAGNHERQLLGDPARMGLSDAHARARLGDAELAWIAGLPPRAAYAPGVHLCHGTPASDLVYLLETVERTGLRAATAAEVEARLGDVDAALVACGHSHVPRAVRARRGALVVNPGSVGLPAYDDGNPHPHVVETGSPDARYAIVETVAGGWRAELVSVPYDHAAMAALARERGREDWARALATGYVRT
ncbi:MAG: metallophosphoesterase family protein [Anaeromyxobacteraceae bacterium]